MPAFRCRPCVTPRTLFTPLSSSCAEQPSTPLPPAPSRNPSCSWCASLFSPREWRSSPTAYIGCGGEKERECARTSETERIVKGGKARERERKEKKIARGERQRENKRARACTRACGVYTYVVTVTVPQNKPARFSIRMHSLGRDEVIMKSLPPPRVRPVLAGSPTRPFARLLLAPSLRNARRRCVLSCHPSTGIHHRRKKEERKWMKILYNPY